MKLDSAVMKKLDFKTSAASLTANALDRLPLLISEKCLAGNEATIVREVTTDYSAGRAVTSSTFSMPRRGFGPRPVTVLAGIDRVAYGALADSLRPDLPAESRTPENWADFRGFGLPGANEQGKYIVTIDIASMYEYVDHEVLRRELLTQSLNAPVVGPLIDLLGEAFQRPRGLPQMMGTSDLLGDVYLGRLERSLLQQERRFRRYVDDFRVLADDWGAANQIIEEAAEVARSLGLILSSEKTSIKRSKRFQEEDSLLQQIVQKYFSEAVDSLTVTFDDLIGPYGEPAVFEDEPDHDEALREAYRQVLNDWMENSRSESGIPTRLAGRAIQGLDEAPERVPNRVLRELVFRDPLRLSTVIRYIAKRSEPEENWKSLRKLVTMKRQSPWAKLWLLQATSDQGVVGEAKDKHAKTVATWVRAQLEDPHEVVRAQAAWVVAEMGVLRPRDVGRLYSAATSITRNGLAAALGRSGASDSDPVSRAITQSSRLSRAAFGWGSKQADG
ncbi:RNA-directed DNA polymerase [Microbacter sp. GSS18]|nr:RNA-directed DNA polymerase [Microbacter sp. GSS18]